MIIKSSAYLYDTMASFHNVRWTSNTLCTVRTSHCNIRVFLFLFIIVHVLVIITLGCVNYFYFFFLHWLVVLLINRALMRRSILRSNIRNEAKSVLSNFLEVIERFNPNKVLPHSKYNFIFLSNDALIFFQLLL
jgi:hypothetical protein